MKLIAFLPISLLLVVISVAEAEFSTFAVKGENYNALQCRPEGNGPFPAIVYNHGSIVDAVGLDEAKKRGNRLDDICIALAKEGFVAFFPIREKIHRGRYYAQYQDYYKDIVNAAIDHVRALHYVDPDRITLMGHSMGGLLTLLVAESRKDLRAIVVSAPATKNQVFGSTVQYANEINAPILLMIERGDAKHIHRGFDELEAALRKHNKVAKIIRYDQGGGHELFFTPDYYWADVITFLKANNS